MPVEVHGIEKCLKRSVHSRRRMSATLHVLGSSTSFGVPAIKCQCHTCTSPDRRDYRYRTSALVHLPPDINVLIDSGPDFRMQCLSAKVDHIDYAIYTHSHADHLNGVADLLALSRRRPLGLFMAQDVYNDMLCRFPFMTAPKYNVKVHIFDGPFTIGNYQIVPIPVMHGRLKIHGFRIGSVAYLTDANLISEESFALLAGVRQLIINGRRAVPHPTHFGFGQMFDEINQIRPERAFTIHMCDELNHQEMLADFASRKQQFPELANAQIEPSYDGLAFEFDPASAGLSG
jgi:phosphoribosyl 1,2-cyclic phosphate phosphodiesterase